MRRQAGPPMLVPRCSLAFDRSVAQLRDHAGRPRDPLPAGSRGCTRCARSPPPDTRSPPPPPVGKRALLHLEGPDVLLFVGPATLEPKPHHVHACRPAIGRNEMEREVRRLARMDLESLLLE